MNARVFVLLGLLVSGELVVAADQVVSDPGDNGGPNQFRAKLAAAQSTGGGTITFTTGAATADNLKPRHDRWRNLVSISGENTFRIFHTTGTVTLRNLTVRNGFSSSNDGGAIFNQGTLTITNCKFFENQTSPNWSGGAIVTYGPLTITDSEFAFNKGGGGGGLGGAIVLSVTPGTLAPGSLFRKDLRGGVPQRITDNYSTQAPTVNAGS
ncbi:hypothetical protein BH20VER1_BH20VER1_29540 [soil metagenome]